ncbi:unnamed protein product [Heligmosomoides polygyrus]|uniref:ShKT domain-containing protein n=1 Tax=Heligmosomoides polygyrus TaxID=6339 RepID=A0A3P7UKU2_HELPZ|nr:unnamed protein product [Heligmosomoides polygyrus]
MCWRWLDRCSSFFFEKIMKEFCGLSCGYCTPKATITASKTPTRNTADESPLCLALTMFPAMDSHIKVFADEERDGDVISLM